MQPVSEQDARRAWLSGQERRNRFVGATHVRARLSRVHPIPCSIVDHRRYEVFVMAQRAAGTEARYEAGKSSAMATSACALSRTMCWRPPLRMPRSSQELMSRLTVYSVVPVISAMS